MRWHPSPERGERGAGSVACVACAQQSVVVVRVLEGTEESRARVCVEREELCAAVCRDGGPTEFLAARSLGTRGVCAQVLGARRRSRRRARSLHARDSREARRSASASVVHWRAGRSTPALLVVLMATSDRAYVFLDVDGVLLPFGDGVPDWQNGDALPDATLEALSFVLERTGATIVLSSTWRASDDAQRQLLTEFARFAKVDGSSPLGRVRAFEHTTSKVLFDCRQREIWRWITERQPEGKIGAWVAIDDEPLIDGPEAARHRAAFAGHVVQTRSDVGLTMALAERAVALLKAQQPQLAGVPPSRGSRRQAAVTQQQQSSRPSARMSAGSGEPAAYVDLDAMGSARSRKRSAVER